jgi:hypothetical protein
LIADRPDSFGQVVRRRLEIVLGLREALARRAIGWLAASPTPPLMGFVVVPGKSTLVLAACEGLMKYIIPLDTS